MCCLFYFILFFCLFFFFSFSVLLEYFLPCCCTVAAADVSLLFRYFRVEPRFSRWFNLFFELLWTLRGFYRRPLATVLLCYFLFVLASLMTEMLAVRLSQQPPRATPERFSSCLVLAMSSRYYAILVWLPGLFCVFSFGIFFVGSYCLDSCFLPSQVFPPPRF